MIENIQKGEIVFCDIYFKTLSAKIHISKGQILSREYNSDIKTKYRISDIDEAKYLAKHGLKQDADIVDVQIHKSLGFKIKNNDFHAPKLEQKPKTAIPEINVDKEAKPRRKPSKPRVKKSDK
jgi:hypothetical protein